MRPRSGTPRRPVLPAAPDAVEDADLADPGEMAEVKAEQLATESGKYGAQPPAPFLPPDEEAEEEGEEPEEEKKTFIEIELLDEYGEPMPGERYEVTVPGGRVAEGVLDENGRARVEGIEEGECEVSFPELDHDSVEYVGSSRQEEE